MAPIDHNLKSFSHYLRELGKLPATIESYSRDAQQFIEYLQSYGMKEDQVEEQTLFHYQNYLAGECGERINSIRRTIIGIRQYYRYLTSTGNLSDNPFEDYPLPHREERLPSLTHVELDHLIEECERTFPIIKSLRDVSIVCLLALEGLKANELISIPFHGSLFCAEETTLNIPGSRSRCITLSELTATRLQLYRQELSKRYEEEKKKNLFIGFKGRESSVTLPTLTRHGLKFMLSELGARAGLTSLNTELLRHYSIDHQLAMGRSPDEIMAHLGLRRPGNIAKHMAALSREQRV